MIPRIAGRKFTRTPAQRSHPRHEEFSIPSVTGAQTVYLHPVQESTIGVGDGIQQMPSILAHIGGNDVLFLRDDQEQMGTKWVCLPLGHERRDDLGINVSSFIPGVAPAPVDPTCVLATILDSHLFFSTVTTTTSEE